MQHCRKCNADTAPDPYCVPAACSRCGSKYQSTVDMPVDVTLPPQPDPGLARIFCVGHGTHDPRDSQFGVPLNVTVRFRSRHRQATPGGNDKRVIPAEDCVAGKRCYNYRLWAMTGAEAFTLPRASTQDATRFRPGGFQAPPGADTWLYVPRVDQSVCLADLVYGLGGAASRGTDHRWEVVWLACRIEEDRDETARKQKTHPLEGTITLV